MGKIFDEKDFEVFDENQRKVLVKVQDKFDEAVKDAVKEATGDNDIVNLNGKEKVIAKDSKKVKKMVELWKNNGKIPGVADRVSYEELAKIDIKHSKEVRDNLSSTDHPMLIPRVISEVVKEAIEPATVLTPLLQRVNYSHGTHVSFPGIGAITAADIPEGGEYPERSLDFAGQVVATIGKSGVAVKMTEEMIRYSMYDVMSLHLRAAGKALIRWKEKKVADLITTNAGGTNTLFDNTSASYPSTTGRDGVGAYNGTLALDDIFKAYATMINRGFTPNALIMNAFGWQLFADEALQRIFGFEHNLPMWQNVQGQLGNAPQWSNGSFGNGLLQNTTVTSPQNIATTFTNVPSFFPYPFKIIVSPYMPYYAGSNTIDIIMCDLSQLGVLIVDEEVTTDRWEDPARDIVKVKLRERYALANVNDGKGTGILKGISLARGYDFAHSVTLGLTGLSNPLNLDPYQSGAITANNN